jgi:aminopeptidase
MDRGALERFADLVVGFGANVQPGQVVAVGSETGKEELTRAIADSAYRHGARFVDVAYFDPYVKRSRLVHAPEETLDYVPPWLGERMVALGEHRAARIGLTGPAYPGLFDELDPHRVGLDRLPALPESAQLANRRTTNWTAAPCPTPGWARLVHPGLAPEEALRRLEEQVLHICRLDEPDPAAAWRERMAVILQAAGRLTEARFDALHFRGPGTDLRIGLLPSSRWLAARFETVDGIVHHPNLPSEEVFTAPDPERVDGVVASTRPLVVGGGTIVSDLVVRFEAGRAVQIDASAGAEVLRTMASVDDGASRLGEVALVDRAGRIGALDTVFYDTLIDENAASHIALGMGYRLGIEDEATRARVNDSKIHVDFMIGSDAVEVDGVTAEGATVPVLRGGDWQL